MTTLYVIVGHNRQLDNISARAVYSRLEDARAHLEDPNRMWFDDRAAVVTLTLDAEVPSGYPVPPARLGAPARLDRLLSLAAADRLGPEETDTAFGNGSPV